MTKTVLIVDDDPVSRALIRMVLEYDAYRCMEAENGACAMALLESDQIDVMLLDHMMPHLTGLELLTRLKKPSTPLYPQTIMISGMLKAGERQKAMELGVTAILEKPYDMGELRELVSHMCAVCPSSEEDIPSFSQK